MERQARAVLVAVLLAVFAAACSKASTEAAAGSGAAGIQAPSGGAPTAGSSGERADPGIAPVPEPASDGGVAGGAGSSDTASAGSTGAPSVEAGRGSSGASGAATSSASGAGGMGGSNGALDATAMAKAMGFGTNLGNTLDNTTSWETGWGQPTVTRAFIEGMARRGIKTVRVPVAWNTYATDGVIDATKLMRVKEIVAWIEAAGMYSIVNIHWDGGWIFNENEAEAYRLTGDVKAKFTRYWEQIAAAFREVGHGLILEGLNEEGRFYVNGDPNGTPDMAALNELNQLFVTTVRKQAGYNTSRALLIAGFHTDIAKTCVEAFSVPADPAGSGRLFLSIHYYDPYTFTLMEEAASWGSPKNTWGTDAEMKAVQESFSRLHTFSTDKKIPVILGEFAVTRGMKVVRQPASRALWMESVAKAALSRGMVPVLWDTGTDIARSDGALSSELQKVMDALE